jgi:hypothetical protein
MKNFILVICALLTTPCFAQTSGANLAPSTKSLTPFEQTLLDHEKAVPEAQKKKDLDFFKRTLTDDFLEVATDGKVYTKDDLLQGILVADLQEFTLYNAQVLPLSDTSALVTYDAIVRMTLGDEPIPRYQRISAVWVKQGEQWKLKFQQATPAQ